jgi:hypothetical protein
MELLGQTFALAPAASQSLTYAYALVGAACVISSRRGHDGLLYGIVLASAALATAALAAHSVEIMGYAAAGGLLSLAMAAPLAGAKPHLQSIHAVGGDGTAPAADDGALLVAGESAGRPDQ